MLTRYLPWQVSISPPYTEASAPDEHKLTLDRVTMVVRCPWVLLQHSSRVPTTPQSHAAWAQAGPAIGTMVAQAQHQHSVVSAAHCLDASALA